MRVLSFLVSIPVHFCLSFYVSFKKKNNIQEVEKNTNLKRERNRCKKVAKMKWYL